MNQIFTASAIFYFINGLYYLYGIILLLMKARTDKDITISDYPFVSVIVPMRNEAGYIRNCLNYLIDQDYPEDRFEIIPVNDASDDETEEILNNISENNMQVRPVHISSHFRNNKGKNNAIDKGIAVSQGEFIITTDADVWMGTRWLRRVVRAFDNHTGLIIGLTLDEFSGKPVHAYQALDSGCIAVIAAALSVMKFPITCQGANMAFRRSAYNEVRDRVLWLSDNSGNHEWQMQEIDISTDWSIKPLANPESFVYTHPPNTWKALLNQRIRWASTGTDYTKLSVRCYLTLIYISLLSFILGLWFLTPGYLALMWGVKLFIDIPVAFLVARVMHQPKLILAFPLVYILQPFIVVITTFLGTLRLYRWK